MFRFLVTHYFYLPSLAFALDECVDECCRGYRYSTHEDGGDEEGI